MMKKLKIILLSLILLFAFIDDSVAKVNTDNLILGLTDGFSITEMETILQNNKVSDLKKWMLKNNYAFVSDDGKIIEYFKNDVVSFYVFYEGKNIFEVRSESSAQKYYYASTFNEDTFEKIKVETKTSKSGKECELTTYKRGSRQYITFDSPYYNISVLNE